MSELLEQMKRTRDEFMQIVATELDPDLAEMQATGGCTAVELLLIQIFRLLRKDP